MGKPDQESAAAEEARRATGDAAGRGRGGRLSARRKRETVLRLLRGEDLESVSRELTVGEGAASSSPSITARPSAACMRRWALEPIRQGVRARFGTIGEGVARGLRLRHDHGSNYLATTFNRRWRSSARELPSFVREPEGNGVAERSGNPAR